MASAATSLHAAKWQPIDPGELVDNTPQVDPDAGAEILLREVTITHSEIDEFVRSHHVRAKIYNERGLEQLAKVDLPYNSLTSIRDIAVRTITAEGEIIELKKADIYDREIIKVGAERIKVKSFSPAGLKPGAIVEYTYEERSTGWSWYVPMYFQSSLPARLVRFRFQPLAHGLPYADLTAKVLSFNCAGHTMKRDARGYYPFEMRDVPAAADEPFRPALLDCRSAVVVCYGFGKNLNPKDYWIKRGSELHAQMIRRTKATKLVEATLASVATAGDPAELKLRKIYDYCRSQLKNRSNDAAQFTPEQRAKFKANETASDTLKLGHGTGEDINVVFVALARAAGLDARFVACNDRSFVGFDPSITEWFMASDLIAAVLLDGTWTYFNPGALYVPYATAHWRNSATGALIASPAAAAPVLVPSSPAEASGHIRRAQFDLDASGTLEGEVTIEYRGHREFFMKGVLDGKTPAERETYIREEVQAYLKLAEITHIKIENAADPLKPLTVRYHLRVPEYADRTGFRLFFQPAVFQKNAPAVFTDATRRSAIVFEFCSSDREEFRFSLPDHFALEQASAPGSVKFGQLGNYGTTVAVAKTGRTVYYTRSLTIQNLKFPPSTYPAIRKAFEIVHEKDAFVLSLKRDLTPSGATETLAPPASHTNQNAAATPQPDLEKPSR